MKNAFGATFIFQIVIFFIVLFTGYICLSINQAKAFNVKNELVKAVERYAPDFSNPQFINEVIDVMEEQGYRLEGDCSSLDGDFDAYSREGIEVIGGTNGAFCIARIGSGIANSEEEGKIPAYYYKVVTFYQLDIPIIRSIFNLKTMGETKLIYKRCPVC